MKRDRWFSRTIFLFAAVGSAIGLGNVWRFPYLTYKFGGGAFLIPYLFALFIVGIPMLMLEFALGQKMQRGPIEAFKEIHPRLKGIGITALLVSFVVVLYYAVVLAWSLIYSLKSFSLHVPWANDSSGYFFNSILGVTSSVNSLGGIQWTLVLMLLIVWTGMFFMVRNGVKSVGQVVKIIVPVPLVILVILFFRGVTLPGATTGIAEYLRPNMAALLSPEIWISAIAQIFFTLSLGFGVMIAYASYNKKDQDINGDTAFTSVVDSVTAIFAGFVVFAIVGYMAYSSGLPISEVATSGPGLAFVVFPQALSLLPFAGLFSICFFLMLLTLGMSSALSLVEAVNTSFEDKYKKPNKTKISFFVCLVGFLLGVIFVTGAGIYFLDIVDHFITDYGLILVGILESVAVGWVYGPEKLREFINKSSKLKIGRWWDYLIKFVIPPLLIALLIVQLVQDIRNPYGGYPQWALAIGWISVAIPIIIGIVVSFRK